MNETWPKDIRNECILNFFNRMGPVKEVEI